MWLIEVSALLTDFENVLAGTAYVRLKNGEMGTACTRVPRYHGAPHVDHGTVIVEMAC